LSARARPRPTCRKDEALGSGTLRSACFTKSSHWRRGRAAARCARRAAGEAQKAAAAAAPAAPPPARAAARAASAARASSPASSWSATAPASSGSLPLAACAEGGGGERRGEGGRGEAEAGEGRKGEPRRGNRRILRSSRVRALPPARRLRAGAPALSPCFSPALSPCSCPRSRRALASPPRGSRSRRAAPGPCSARSGG